MDDKQTLRKADLDRLETNLTAHLVNIEAMIEKLPTREELFDLAALRRRLANVLL